MSAFFVAGVPQPQGSKTAYVRGGRAVVVDKNPALLKPWREAVSRAAAEKWADRTAFTGAVRVEAAFVLARPASVKREYPHVRPDLDKLLRALLDGITDSGEVWSDDSQVVEVVSSKAYGAAPGVHVTVTAVGSDS